MVISIDFKIYDNQNKRNSTFQIKTSLKTKDNLEQHYLIEKLQE